MYIKNKKMRLFYGRVLFKQNFFSVANAVQELNIWSSSCVPIASRQYGHL